ncbi:MAG: 50S ribosomal protein L4 [Parcubacteria group bacterium GW2011_GWC1_43_12]|nr:MAG: 50S ribosomal protein L4 [Parcubacteria group bacterium GW2011_GWC1_43_12]
MITAIIHNQEGKETGKMNLSEAVFGLKANADLIKQAVKAQMSQARIPYAHTKTRGEVRGGGKKPWRQKGTGRARHGSTRSPIWVGGGVVFGPRKEKKFAQKINKQMKRKALFMVLSGKLRDSEMIILDDLKIKEAKTKKMALILKNLQSKFKDLNKGLVIVLPGKNENVVRASKNLPKTETLRADSLNVVDLLSKKYILLPKESVEMIEKNYSK